MSRVAVQFDDSPYFRSHGKAPRGQGGWGFVDINAQNDVDQVRFFHGSYSEARKQARAFFAVQPGFSGIAVVMP